MSQPPTLEYSRSGLANPVRIRPVLFSLALLYAVWFAGRSALVLIIGIVAHGFPPVDLLVILGLNVILGALIGVGSFGLLLKSPRLLNIAGYAALVEIIVVILEFLMLAGLAGWMERLVSGPVCTLFAISTARVIFNWYLCDRSSDMRAGILHPYLG